MESNKYTESKLEVIVKACKELNVASTVQESINMVAYVQSIQNVLLAQISESLAILANNTRLIQDKEAVKESK